MEHFSEGDEVWLFGYGSLIYKVDFPWVEREPASIKGWVRRFWQGSHDHRGTPESPGRVVTLVPESGAVCQGMAYRVSAAVFTQLDHREKNGYLRELVNISFADGFCSQGLVYIASQDNAAFLGAASEQEIAQQIAVSQGPSGHNKDYLFALANALRAMQNEDFHVFTLEKYVKDVYKDHSE